MFENKYFPYTYTFNDTDTPEFDKRLIVSLCFIILFQIDLGRLYRICAVATQGNSGGRHDYLKEYKVRWSKDNVTWEESPEVWLLHYMVITITGRILACSLVENYAQLWTMKA